jgi:hypothetical protein
VLDVDWTIMMQKEVRRDIYADERWKGGTVGVASIIVRPSI